MRKVILVSHGELAMGMKNAVQMIIGDKEEIYHYGLFEGEHPKTIYSKILSDVREHPEEEYIVVSDVFGGSVNNAMLSLLKEPQVHLLTGMNLGLIISLCLGNESTTSELIKNALHDSSQNIMYINDWFQKQKGGIL